MISLGSVVFAVVSYFVLSLVGMYKDNKLLQMLAVVFKIAVYMQSFFVSFIAIYRGNDDTKSLAISLCAITAIGIIDMLLDIGKINNSKHR